WSMMKRLVSPRPGARRTLPAIMEPPSSPDAIMCSDRMLAPALVPPTVTPRVEVHDRDACRPDVGENLFVARSGLVHAARGRDDDDVGRRAARDAYEALEDAAVIFLILCAADRND